MIQLQNFREGEIFIKWMHARLIRQNKNVLSVELGATGSGKSYRDLRKVELWYQYYFKEKFPVENICFGVGDVLKRLSSGKLRRGEVLIFEEAGANLGNLDFQNKVSKMFNYVLQSFRSMNVAIFFNLPYLSMLNKTARMLIHYSSESKTIDMKRSVNRCRPLFHQVNQSTGKIYKKYPRAKVEGRTRTVKEFEWTLPSDYLIEAYEQKKKNYLETTTKKYVDKINGDEKKEMQIPKDLTKQHIRYLKYLEEGLNQKEIAEKEGVTKPNVCKILKTIKKRLYEQQHPKEIPKLPKLTLTVHH